MEEERRKDYSELHNDLQMLRNEMHSLKAEIIRLERLIKENETKLEPVVDVYKKILVSSEVGGFVAKVIGGILGMVGAIASLWLIFKGGGNGGG